ncbi:hypothetical protein ANO11243_066400 [Dothideomycetidae sp. 11243]|nr:hypothetical protein ANO11243_066400 [fungal sp. No.11243]
MGTESSIARSLHTLRVTAEICLAITVASILLRLWTRGKVMGKIQFDDWAAIAAWIITSGTALYVCSMALLKVSLGAFFLRIFSVHRTQRLIIHVVVITTVVYSIVTGIFAASTCGSWSGFFASESSCKTSRPFTGITTSWSVLNAMGDMIFSLLSVDALRRAQMRFSTKCYASAVLVLGTAGGVASIIRICIITSHTKDRGNLQGITGGFWTLLEMCIGITAANLACLRPLLRLARQEMRSRWAPESYSMDSLSQPATTQSDHSQFNFDRLYMLSGVFDTKDDLSTSKENPTRVVSWRQSKIYESIDKVLTLFQHDGEEIQRPAPTVTVEHGRLALRHLSWRLSFGGSKIGALPK